MDVESEIRDLQRRVGELEGSFGFLTSQTRAVHRDLLNFQAQTDQRFDRLDEQFEGVDRRFDRLEGEVQSLRGEVSSLREDLPGIVGSAVREAFSERKR